MDAVLHIFPRLFFCNTGNRKNIVACPKLLVGFRSGVDGVYRPHSGDRVQCTPETARVHRDFPFLGGEGGRGTLSRTKGGCSHCAILRWVFQRPRCGPIGNVLSATLIEHGYVVISASRYPRTACIGFKLGMGQSVNAGGSDLLLQRVSLGTVLRFR